MFFDRLIAVLNSSTINYTHNANNELTVAGTIAYLYDQNGNTIQETNPPQADKITKYIYNTSNRLERVELPDGRIAEYKYDPFGRRISKTINNSASADGHTTYYLYADEGLIGEYDSSGNLQKAYGWTPDSIWGTNPVFMLENDQYYFYHNNHLGTPEKITDINGTVVWSAEYTAYGEAIVNEDPDGDGIKFVNNLRLPGQYYDEETKKHYNFNRYYDPGTGRYISADPIGFGGRDANLYRYVWNQPNSGIDPLGLLNFTFDPDYLVGPQAVYNTGTGLINLFLSKDNKIDPIKIFNISYTLSIDAGEQYGEEAALYWAQKQFDNRDKWYSPVYAVPGLFASLWTTCTSDATLATLTAAYGAGKAVVPAKAATQAGVKEGIYEFTGKSGKSYVGQSGDIPNRILQHSSSGKLPPGNTVTTTEVLGGKTAREVAEQLRIRDLGGLKNLENIRNPIGKSRGYLLN